jgi:hypothetical protein
MVVLVVVQPDGRQTETPVGQWFGTTLKAVRANRIGNALLTPGAIRGSESAELRARVGGPLLRSSLPAAPGLRPLLPVGEETAERV